MKITITFKDSDALLECIDEEVRNQSQTAGLLSPDEKEALIENRKEKIEKLCKKWFQYGEYIDLEIDTEKETIKVVPVKDYI